MEQSLPQQKKEDEGEEARAVLLAGSKRSALFHADSALKGGYRERKREGRGGGRKRRRSSRR